MPSTIKHGRIGGFETQSTHICYLIIFLLFEVFSVIRDIALLIALSNKHSICIFVDIKHNSV